MILAVTGHRPPKIGGYHIPNRMSVAVSALLIQYLQREQPEYVITGMALGFDQWVAAQCRAMGIKYKAYVPCASQDSMWPYEAKAVYQSLLHDADEVFLISDTYTPDVMQRRNQRMVDACDKLLALWNGTAGGTQNCVSYALARGRQVDRLPVPDDLWAWCRQIEEAEARRRAGGQQSRFRRGGTVASEAADTRIYRRRGAVQNPPRSTIVDELFAEQRRAQVEEITRAFQIPAQLLGVDQATGPDETRVALPDNMDDETARAMLRALQQRLGNSPKPKQSSPTTDRFAPRRKIDLDE